MIYTIKTKLDLTPAFNYAERLLRTTNKPITVVITKQKLQRSTSQNAYYWSVILKIIGDELGYFPEEIHQAFATMFLKQIIKIGDQSIETYRSTTKLKTDEFEDYLAKIRIFASSELGILIPLPNEVIDYEH